MRVSISTMWLVSGLKKYNPSGSDSETTSPKRVFDAAMAGVDHLDAAAGDAHHHDGDDRDPDPHEDPADGQFQGAIAPADIAPDG